MGNGPSQQQEEQQVEPQLRPPKHMLWGCETPEEHYACIQETCEKAVSLEGKEGLQELGFEFRMLHVPGVCMCDDGYLTDDEGDDMDDSGEEEDAEEFLVPVGSSLKQRPRVERTMSSLIESTIDQLSHQQEQDAFRNSSSVPRTSSAVSLFSLATHCSSEVSGQQFMTAESCSLRLFHVPSNSLVTADNYATFIANGEMYDQVARLAMECSQQKMMEEGDLEWVTICDARDIRALVSRNRVQEEVECTTSDNATQDAPTECDTRDAPPTNGECTTDKTQSSKQKKRKVLLVVTGKGKVRAGIFSRRHLLTTGMETATALPLVKEALAREMQVVMLDPNSKGHQMGMEVVEASLQHLFFDFQEEEEIYVLAHSMAGAQLVRFLHNTSKDQAEETAFLRKIKAVAFTDSNHNINWTKDNESLQNLLVGPSCLYVKSHKPHDDPKSLGEEHEECPFWRHRFGSLRTIWAGTHEHALTNYTARFHIWDHFDAFLHKSQHSDDSEVSKEDEEEKGNGYKDDVVSF